MTGSRLVAIIESSPLDDASDVMVDEDTQFMPLLREVLGSVPGIVMKGAEQEVRGECVGGRACGEACTWGVLWWGAWCRGGVVGGIVQGRCVCVRGGGAC